MNKPNRAAAVAATFLLATAGVQGTANAQDLGSVIDAIGPILGPFTGSAGDLAGGSAGLDPLSGSADLPALSSDPLGGSSALPGSSDLLGGSS
ncbi:hypothetical protein G6025_15970, partial [Dietzia natronolimnaea]|uniref:hypothetical protein n=2 Tax=Dietziaceae TaxID=85029 RepID=UPI0019D58419